MRILAAIHLVSYFYGTSAWASRQPFISSSTTALAASSVSESITTTSDNSGSQNKVIPVTVLSGFLGSGKTTLLQHLLHNNQGLKLAVIVNDVAAVNIDSKLVSSFDQAAGMVELQNGCACCSRSEELLASVQELVTLSDLKAEGDQFDHIVVELSGVADPRSIRAKFQEAEFYNMPLTERIQLDTMITVVDCSVYLDHLKSEAIATPEESPALYYREGEQEEDRQWMDDIPAGLLEAVLAGERSNANAVADLLISQTEIADIILLNKVDLVEPSTGTLQQIKAVVTALNPRADIMQSEFGKIPLKDILGVMDGQGVALAGVVDDLRDAVEAASECADADCTDTSHSHSHSSHAKADDCADPACTDTSHSHSHSHTSASDCVDTACTDTSHSHSHSSHATASDCADPACTDTSHSHSHSNHASASDCADPTCIDTSHSHSHSHSSTIPVEAGIGSFVFQSRRPFHPDRLLTFLSSMRLKRGLPKDVSVTSNLDISSETKSALQSIVRSKGFVWCADSHVAARYWSHAGIAFELNNLGRWWATLPQDQWPAEAKDVILGDFDNASHDEKKQNSSNGTLESVGDRRQELVVIGTADKMQQESIRELLNKCVLNDEEWSDYCKNCNDEAALREKFENPLQITLLRY